MSSKQIILIGGGCIIIAGIIGLSVYVIQKDTSKEAAPLAPIATTSAGLSDFTLAHPEIIPQMSATTSTGGVISGSGAAVAKPPVVSPQQIQKIKTSATASPEIKRPTRTAEQQRLLDSMSVQ